MELKIYLSGSILNSDNDFQNWRKECIPFSKNGYYPNLKFVDPNNYFNYTDKLPQTDKQCLDLFMYMVEQCDILLINLDLSEKSIGSCMEVEHAFCHGKPIIGFGKYECSWYNWAKTRASVVFNTLEDAIDYISNTYGDI